MTQESKPLRDTEHQALKNSPHLRKFKGCYSCSYPFVLEFCFQFDVHRLDSFLVEMLATHRTRELRDFSLPVTRCQRKSSLSPI